MKMHLKSVLVIASACLTCLCKAAQHLALTRARVRLTLPCFGFSGFTLMPLQAGLATKAGRIYAAQVSAGAPDQ